MEFESYIIGFVDGEGTFNVSFNYRAKLKTKVEVRPSFSISQNKRNLSLLKRIHSFLGVGSIRFSKRDQCYKYEVRSVNDLVKVIIPHFQKYSLQTAKSQDFQRFLEISKIVSSSHHLSKDGIEGIIELAYEMNPSGKRRYKKSQLLRFITG